MQIVCPNCSAKYNISDRKLPSKTTFATCKRCGGRITVEPEPQLRSGSETSQMSPRSEHSQSATAHSAGQESSKSAVLRDFPDLQALDLRKVDLERVFTPNKIGGYKSRKNKLKCRILTAAHPVLDKILHEAERVIQVGKGVAYYPVELFLGNGWLTMIYNHYAILVTNKRLLFVNINSRIKKPTHYFFQIPYAEISKVRKGLLSRSLIIYRKGKRRRIFNYVKGFIFKELQQLIMEKAESTTMAGAPQERHEFLCPSCFAPLENESASCHQCRASFKEPKKAFIRSLFLPGLGDIYLGHTALGIFELVGSLIVWTIAISFVISGNEGAAFGGLFLLVVYNLFDGLLTLHMAKKGHMLA